MSIKSLFHKYILPHEVDFVGMLQEQSSATHKMVEDLHICFTEHNHSDCVHILKDEHRTKELKNRNMEQLLNVFITPIDRESIYRAVTQLDWITIAIKHFVQETHAYNIKDLSEYKGMFDLILEGSSSLNDGFEALGKHKSAKVSKLADKIRDHSDKISQVYIEEMVKLSTCKDHRKMFVYREILVQLKEIGRRLNITANTLQDIVVKMD
jgi:uncharacterized protein Yka (UPF0111/DUF47 family)